MAYLPFIFFLKIKLQGDPVNSKSARNDLTIEDTFRFRKLKEAFLSLCSQFGYNEIKTATIQPLHIFTALGAMNENRLRRIYSFIDWDGWSGERVALKPDSTACVARFYGDHLNNGGAAQKLCYIENHFEWADTWDEISERWQCGVENIGAAGPEADIETIYMAFDILSKLGIDNFYLRLAYPSISDTLNEFLSSGDLDGLMSGQSDRGAEYHTANYLINLKAAIPELQYKKIRPAFEDFLSIAEHLDQLSIPYRFEFSPHGDLAYYTGIRFQFLSAMKRKSGSDVLCSGGRYDRYVSEVCGLENDIPAIGFALYARNILRCPAMLIADQSPAGRLQYIMISVTNIVKRNVSTAQILCDRLDRLGFIAQITLHPVEIEDYENFGLIIEVDHERFADGYQVLFSQKIGKPLLENLFREFGVR